MTGIVALILRLLLAICLYAFLGLALFLSWKELQTLGISLSTRKVTQLHLLVRSTNKQENYHTFQKPVVITGRDPACDIPLIDDTVSAQHAIFSYHHGQWWVEDNNSTNGTRLNQIPIATPTVITTGDQIECGHTILTIRIGEITDPGVGEQP